MNHFEKKTFEWQIAGEGPSGGVEIRKKLPPCRDNSEKCGSRSIETIAFLARLGAGIFHIAILPLHASTASIVVAVAVAA